MWNFGGVLKHRKSKDQTLPLGRKKIIPKTSSQTILCLVGLWTSRGLKYHSQNAFEVWIDSCIIRFSILYLQVKIDGLPIPKGRLVKGPSKPICRDCAIYFSIQLQSPIGFWDHISVPRMLASFSWRIRWAPPQNLEQKAPENFQFDVSFREMYSLNPPEK